MHKYTLHLETMRLGIVSCKESLVHKITIVNSFSLILSLTLKGGCPRGVMVKAMDCGIVVREFVLQSCYYIHFWANTLGKGMNP